MGQMHQKMAAGGCPSDFLQGNCGSFNKLSENAKQSDTVGPVRQTLCRLSAGARCHARSTCRQMRGQGPRRHATHAPRISRTTEPDVTVGTGLEINTTKSGGANATLLKRPLRNNGPSIYTQVSKLGSSLLCASESKFSAQIFPFIRTRRV